MTLAPAHADALAPLLLPERLQLTPEQFEAVCQANPGAVLELDASGQLIQITPTGGETGARNSTLLILLGLAIRTVAPPLKLFDSSTGFRLPDGSVLSRMPRWCGWIVGRPSRLRSVAASCPFALIWWWSWPALATKALAASQPCAARWPFTRPTAPSSAGC